MITSRFVLRDCLSQISLKQYRQSLSTFWRRYLQLETHHHHIPECSGFNSLGIGPLGLGGDYVRVALGSGFSSTGDFRLGDRELLLRDASWRDHPLCSQS